MTTDSTDLQFFVSEKNSVLVVSIAGRLHKKSEAVLEECKAEIVNRRPRFVILYLRELADRVDINALPALVRLQKAVRDLPAELKICGVHPEFKKLLEQKGLLRLGELARNLEEALKAIA
jgi:anti-anti-sigma factor